MVYRPSHPGPLSPAIPPWIGAKSTGDGEFCVVVSPATLAVNLNKTSSQNALYASLIWSSLRRLKGEKGDELPRYGLHVAVTVSVAKYVRITIVCKNSVRTP